MVQILPITKTRAQFQRQHENITTYTQKLIERNYPRGIDVDQEDVSHYWWLLSNRLFPKGDSEGGKWMSQIGVETGGAATDKEVESEDTEGDAGDQDRDRDFEKNIY